MNKNLKYGAIFFLGGLILINLPIAGSSLGWIFLGAGTVNLVNA